MKLKPLAQLPPLHNMLVFHQRLPDLVLAAAENPGVVEAMAALRTSGEAVRGVVRVPRAPRPGAGRPIGRSSSTSTAARRDW